jgi:hypothetical protein
VFDVNTLAAYRGVPDVIVEDEDTLLRWRGALAELSEPGGQAEVVIDVFLQQGDGLWRRSLSRQRHRHHPVDELRELIEDAGLEVAAVLGQLPGAVLDPDLDEQLHSKAVFIARREGRA